MARPYAASMPTVRARREPLPFRRIEIARTELLTPRMRRLTLTGPELAGLPEDLPAGSVRLLVPTGPHDPDGRLELPTWNGNEFRYADGTRPPIRTLTPRRAATGADTGAGAELDVDVVLHDGGTLSTWASTAAPGDALAITGTGRGYTIDPTADRFILAGDETALPGIAVVLEALPSDVPVDVVVEVAHPDARLELPPHANTTVTWCDLAGGANPGAALLPAMAALDLTAATASGTRLWAAGEAAAMQRLRKHLFDAVGLARSQTVVRGYWKVGRSADGIDPD
jgi:NADPH-dependent ferric siderophore reductase